MSYLIVGGGRVGLRTARTLAEQGYDVVIVEEDHDTARRAREAGFTVVEGDGADADVLEGAGIAEAEAVAGLTGDLNVNFAACMLGVEYGTRTVMRIDEDYKEAIYEKYAGEVDEVIYPEQLGAMGAKTALLGGNFNTIADLTEELELLTVTVPAGSPAIGQRITDLDETLGLDRARVYAHGRSRQSLTIPLPGTTIERDDQLALIAEREAVDAVRATLLGSSPPA
jgi:trk system potassium uptake protein TrkA